jgi:uncharacterized membrane protein
MPSRLLISILVSLIVMASDASAADPRGVVAQSPAVRLVDTIAARHALGLAGTWDVLQRRQVIDADGAAVAASLYALRGEHDIRALILVQRNVLPSASGWGSPTACHAAAGQPSLTVYQSPRDVLCGWARAVSFTSPTRRDRLGEMTTTWLGPDITRLGTQSGTWQWLGLRVSNRSDFLDIQLLVRNESAVPRAAQQAFLADMAHSMDATWLTAGLAARPAPPVAARPDPSPKETSAATAAGPWWTGGLSASALKTATYRAAVSVKTFIVASVMAGDAATGGAIIVVLNVTSTGIYLLNDYLWETWNPLVQPSQDFVRLVDTR